MRDYAIFIQALDNLGNPTLLTYSGYGITLASPSGPINFEARILNPAINKVDMFASGTTSGFNQIGYGYIELINADGGLDYLTEYSISSGPVYTAILDTDDLTSIIPVASGIVDFVVFAMDKITINFKSNLKKLDTPILTEVYGGTNVLPAGVDGTSDIAGLLKPRLFGKVNNLTPILVNTSVYIYQVSLFDFNMDVDFVYDSGVVLSRASPDFTTLNDLVTAGVPAGQYRVYLGSEGLFFKLGSPPAGAITCDATQDSVFASNNSVLNVAQSLASKVDTSITIDPLASATGTPLEYVCGVYVTDNSAALTTISQIFESVGAFIAPESPGVMLDPNKFICYFLEDLTSATPNFYITRSDIIDIERSTTGDTDKGVPAWKLTIKYAKNYTVQNDSDLAGSVTTARRNILSKEYLTTTATYPAIQTANPLAPEIERTTLLYYEADAISELTRLAALYTVPRTLYIVTVAMEDGSALPYINDIVNLKLNRFSLDAGVNFRVLGVESDYQSMKYKLTLWG